MESDCLSFCSHLLWGQCLPSLEPHQTSFLVKPEEGNNAVMMRIWLRAQEDMATRTELMAFLLDTLQGRVGSLEQWSLVTHCSTRSDSFFYCMSNTHTLRKPKVLGKEQKSVQAKRTAIICRKRDAKPKLLNLRFSRLPFPNL